MENPVRLAAAGSLAVVGTAAVGFPLAAPIVLAIALLVTAQGLHVDYLLPGELFVAALAGGILLVSAALLVRRRRALVIVVTAVVAALLAAVGLIAALTGVGTGDAASTAWLPLVITVYVLYVASVAALFGSGVALCRDLFARRR